jgi:hypothetical protein
MSDTTDTMSGIRHAEFDPLRDGRRWFGRPASTHHVVKSRLARICQVGQDQDCD